MQLQTPRGKLLEGRHEALKAITRDTLHQEPSTRIYIA